MKRFAAMLLALLLTAAVAGCGTGRNTDGQTGNRNGGSFDHTVGICMPNDDTYWKQSAQHLKKNLEDQGCKALVQYAQNDVQLQKEQVEQLLTEKVNALVIGAVDSVALVPLEQQARKAGVAVVAYDRLLMDTDCVDALVTFDYVAIGAAMAAHIADSFRLASAEGDARQYTIEFFMGSPDDNNALLIHQGVFSVLQPYLDSGVLVSATGRTSFEDTCILREDRDTAMVRCSLYLEDFYRDTKLDILCTASDTLAAGCIEAFEQAQLPREKRPMVTGQGGSLEAVRAIAASTQSMTVHKDTQALAARCAEIVHALVSGQTPELSDRELGANHVITVPAWVGSFTAADRSNYKKVFLDSGIYTRKQLDAAG